MNVTTRGSSGSILNHFALQNGKLLGYQPIPSELRSEQKDTLQMRLEGEAGSGCGSDVVLGERSMGRCPVVYEGNPHGVYFVQPVLFGTKQDVDYGVVSCSWYTSIWAEKW